MISLKFTSLFKGYKALTMTDTNFLVLSDLSKKASLTIVAIKVKFKEQLKKAVSLENIKKIKALNHLSLIKQSRLSVMPIDFKSWKIIYKMGKV